MKRILHVQPKLDEAISVNCPICGVAHITQENGNHWRCVNGHALFVDVYQSSAKTLNLAVMYLPEESHGNPLA